MFTLLTLLHITPQGKVLLVNNKQTVRHKLSDKLLLNALLTVVAVMIVTSGFYLFQKGLQTDSWLFTSFQEEPTKEQLMISTPTVTSHEPTVIIVPMMVK